MSMLDGLMQQFGGQIGPQLAQMVAQKFGIDPAMAQMAIAALTRNHPLPNNTVEAASAETGMSTDVLGQIVSQIGGEGALGQLGGMLGGAGQPGAAPGAAGAGGIGDVLGGLMGSVLGARK